MFTNNVIKFSIKSVLSVVVLAFAAFASLNPVAAAGPADSRRVDRLHDAAGHAGRGWGRPDEQPLAAAAGSLRDMTRVAGANPQIWVDIFLENSEALTDVLRDHREGLEELEAALLSRDRHFIAEWINKASGHRSRLLKEAYSDVGRLHRLEVHVADRPGVFAVITQALASESINIENFEVHHLSIRTLPKFISLHFASCVLRIQFAK